MYPRCWRRIATAAPSKNAVSAFQISYKLLSFYLDRFLKKLADDQCSSITKGSIYHIKHMYMQLFRMEVDWPEIGCLMEISTMFYICRYYVFTWDSSWTNSPFKKKKEEVTWATSPFKKKSKEKKINKWISFDHIRYHNFKI